MLKIIDRELKHATFRRGRNGATDTHYIKELITYEDGTSERKLQVVKDYLRPFWITKKPYRNHKQVKEAELLDKLDKGYSTETDLAKNISKGLKRQKFGNVTMRDIKTNPDSVYVYGADVDSVTMIAMDYKKLGEKITPHHVGYLDIENHPYTKIISVISYVYRDLDDKRVKIHCFINRSEMPDLFNARELTIKRFKEVLPKDLPKSFDINDIDFFVNEYDKEKPLLIDLFDRLHDKPIDILAGWGFIYDVKELKAACERNGLSAARMFSHPSVPDKDCFLEILEAPSSKTKENGDVVSVPFEERWHKFNSASMFKMIDNMAAYKYIRLQAPKLKGGYGFDNVMKFMGLSGKLMAVDLPPMSKLKWHLTMLEKHQLDYVVYNWWDTLALLYKDEMDTDLSIKLPLFCGISSMNKFNSNPNRIYDDFYALYLEEGKVIANKILNKPNLESLGREDWTITVNLWKQDPLYFDTVAIDDYDISLDVSNTRAKRLIDFGYSRLPKLLKSRVCSLSYDLDIISSYPSAASALNVSADTVRREIINVVLSKGVTMEKETMKMNNIALVSGVVSDMQYCESMFNLPTFIDLDTVAKRELCMTT